MPRVLLHRFNTHVVAKLEDSWVTGSQRPTPAYLSVGAVKIRTEHKTTIRDIVACMSACPIGRRSSNQGIGIATSRLEKASSAARGAGLFRVAQLVEIAGLHWMKKFPRTC
jgi:hypothetical protein